MSGTAGRAGQGRSTDIGAKGCGSIGQDRAMPGGEIMFQKINLIRVGLSKMDIVLTVLICVTISALYAAFLT
jgi:hypothetical protein